MPNSATRKWADSGSELRARGRARDLRAAYAAMEPTLAARFQAADRLAGAVERWMLGRKRYEPSDFELVSLEDAMLDLLLDWQKALVHGQLARMQP